jgi:N6-L-threonylcarbamoyladenine synthase
MTRLVLGIETSCDETAAAVVADGREVRSNVVHSQVELHRRFLGVIPELASRSHTTRILPIVRAALDAAGVRPEELTGVAVTHRPGMIGCLLVGLAAAKALSLRYELPLAGVDHVQAHIHVAFLAEPALELPALALVASGGHTALWLVTGRAATVRLGGTRDDAAGEAFDKGAALLGLEYPGGPSVERAARGGDPGRVAFPRTLLAPDSLDFSFSGVKTALLYHLRGNGLERPLPVLAPQEVADLAASYQAAIVDVLVAKLARAAARTGARSLVIGGGVARNARLREAITQAAALGGLRHVFPPLDLCSDNGAMIAALGDELLLAGRRADLDLEALATAEARSAP